MRELTATEKASLYDEGRCPFCASSLFIESPQQQAITREFRCAMARCEALFRLSPAEMFIGQLVTGPYTFGTTLPRAYRSREVLIGRELRDPQRRPILEAARDWLRDHGMYMP